MSKKFIAIKKTKKLLKHFSFILKNKSLQGSYDKDNKLSSYIVLFLINRLGNKETLSLLKNNKDAFIGLFAKLECNEQVASTLKEFNENSYESIELIEEKKTIFNDFASSFINLISSLKIDLGLPEQIINEFICRGLIYILYSLVDCQIEKDLEDILSDPNYDKKISMITNITLLFSKVRDLILMYCKTNVSDFVGLINGLTNMLAKK